MKSRFLKTSRKPHERLILFDALPSRANFLSAVPPLKKECETNPSREQKTAAVFALQADLAEEKSQSFHSQKYPR